MLFRVSGASFKWAVTEVIGGSSKKSINFTFKEKKLRLQANTIVVVEEFVDIIEQDIDSESFTATLDNTINLINPEHVLNIRINGDTMVLSQQAFEYAVTREYEEAIEYACQSTDISNVDKVQLTEVEKDVRSLELVTRTFGLDSVTVAVYEKVCYVDGKSIVYIAPLDLPNVSMTSRTLKALKNVLKGNATMCLDKQTLVFACDGKRVLSTVDIPDVQAINSLRSIPNSMKLLSKEFDIGRYSSTIEILYKVYKNSLVNVSICRDGLSLFVDNGVAKIMAGNGQDKLCTIQLSMQQAFCMCKIMGEVDTVDVYGGVNKICLKQKNSKKTLMLAGITY